MKKTLILILIAIGGTFSVKAQTQKGNQLLGGFLGFSTGSGTNNYTNGQNGTNSTDKTSSFSIGPSYSYFIANNLDLGASIGYTDQKTNYSYLRPPASNAPLVYDSRSFASSIYLRKYFLYNGKIGIRTGPYAQYFFTKSDQNYIDPASNYNYQIRSINAGLGLDLVYFPTKKLGLSSSIGSLAYNHSTSNQTYVQTKSDSFALNLSSAVNLSIFYSFGK
ncbi:MAG: hypothetical protein JWR67_1320 [Mucilaginibacter sp.]|nr:hypothetical protein [Mucilaginibacter sp.]